MMSGTVLPETILQLGAGRFLRAFADRFVHQANEEGQNIGRIVIVQSTEGARADLLKSQPEGYHVVVRGYHDGETIDRVDPVTSVSRALAATSEWASVLEVARSPDLKYVITNATEAGYATNPQDQSTSAPPQAMPAKLVRLLWERYQAGQAPLCLLPCELIEGNAALLRDIVAGVASDWDLPADFIHWMTNHCLWLTNLVDCIVTPGPADHPLSATDRLLVTAEPYNLWAIRKPTEPSFEFIRHPAISLVDDVAPYYLRKVRILNGLHTAMAARFLNTGAQIVLDVMRNKQMLRWLRDVAFEEIVPTIAHRVTGAAEFADQVFDRFANPFLAHRLADIANNHEAKVAVRLRPTIAEYTALFGHPPRLLGALLPS